MAQIGKSGVLSWFPWHGIRVSAICLVLQCLLVLLQSQQIATPGGCESTLCIQKVAIGNTRLFTAVYNGKSSSMAVTGTEGSIAASAGGSVLVFFKLASAEAGVHLTSPYTIKRGSDGEPYLFFVMDDTDNTISFLRADIISSGEWVLPKYSWSYANLFGKLCLDNGDVCLEEILSSDGTVRTITAINNKYIEQSIQFKITGQANTLFKLWDDTPITDEIITVVPRRLPSNNSIPDTPIQVLLFTAYQQYPAEGWWFSFQFYGRRGDYRVVTGDNYLYDLPFIGTFYVSQGFNEEFSHTGWEAYAIDWNMNLQTEVYSARDGVVCFVKEDQYLSKFDDGVCPEPVSSSCTTPYSDGNTIIIRHDDGTWGLYTHLIYNGAVVKEGDVIKGKTLIGYSGNTGFSMGPHLHFQNTKTSVFDHPEGWTAETIPFQNINLKGEGFIPVVGNSYSATGQYQAQPVPIRNSLIDLPNPPIVSKSFRTIAMNQKVKSSSECLCQSSISMYFFFSSLLLLQYIS